MTFAKLFRASEAAIVDIAQLYNKSIEMYMWSTAASITQLAKPSIVVRYRDALPVRDVHQRL